jgi:hypothetical protein
MIKDKTEPQGCQAVQGVYVGLSENKVYSGPIRCNSWHCPYCAQIKLKQLRKRLYNGEISLQGIPKYGFKFATLTFGGTEARQEYIIRYDSDGQPVYDVTAMYDKMMYVFNNMRRSLSRKFGKFMYFRVHEPHKDGVPHLHVLFAGKNVVPKSFYTELARLWELGGLGWVKLSAIRDRNGRVIKSFNDAKHAVNYLCKYLTKGMLSAGKYKRIFSSSRGALMPIQKKEWEVMEIIMGRVDDKGNCIEEVCPIDQAIVDVQHTMFRAPWDETPPPNVLETIMDRHFKYHTTTERK